MTVDCLRSGARRADVALKVLGGSAKPYRIIIKEPQATVAPAAQDSTDDSSAVAMVDGGATYTTAPGHCLRGSTDAAVSGLQTQRGTAFGFLDVVSTSPFDPEARAAKRSEGCRVRTTVGVGVTQLNIASGTASSGSSHCPILPGLMPTRGKYGNAVTPPVAEIIVSALVECVTGESLERAA